MKAVRTIAIVVVVILVLGFAAWYGLGALRASRTAAAQAAATPAPSEEVRRGPIEETVSATGNVAADRTAALTLRTSGQVQRVLVREGQTVEAGDVLVELDDTDLRGQVERAEASLATARARLGQAKLPATEGQIAAAQASVASATASLNKLLAGPTEMELQSARLSIDSAKNQLWGAQAQRDATKGNPVSSGGNKDSAEAQVLVAEVAVQQAELSLAKLQAPPQAEDVAAARAQVQQAQAQLAQLDERPSVEEIAVTQASVNEAELALKLARQSLSNARLEAPFAGTVLSVNVNEGEWAAPGSPAVRIADTGTLVLDVLLDEVDVAQVHEDQAVRLTFDALPSQMAEGMVDRMAPGATQTSAGQAYGVTVHFVRGELPVRVGMSAKVDIVTQHVNDALLVSNRAIEADRAAGRYYVNRKTALGSERVEVKIGLRDDNATQIVEGLEVGDTILQPTIDVGGDSAMPMGFGALRGQTP
jgi:HlyD family secretion protein